MHLYWGAVYVDASPAVMSELEEWLFEYTRFTVSRFFEYDHSQWDWLWVLLGYKITYIISVAGGTEAEWTEISKLFDIEVHPDVVGIAVCASQ